MSGGSYNYAEHQLRDLADQIRMKSSCDDIAAPPHVRKAFTDLLRKCADAMHAIEWNDSGDGARDEEALIRACLPKGGPLATLLDEAGDVMKRLRTEVEAANRRTP